MQLTKPLVEKLKEKSKDYNVFDSLHKVTAFFHSKGTDVVTIGSCAVASHFNYIYRLPNDIDLVISQKSFKPIESNLNDTYNLIEKNGYHEFYVDRFKVHLVIDSLKIIDFKTNDIFTQIDLDLPKDFIESKKLISKLDGRDVPIKTPKIEIGFLLSLLGPLNTNTTEDAIKILESFNLDPTIVLSFIDRQNEPETVRALAEERLAQLLTVLYRHRQYNRHAIEKLFDFIFKLGL